MSLYINYDEDFIIDLTPEEILEDQELEKQYFDNMNNRLEETTNPNSNNQDEQQNAENLFFDLEFYNLDNLPSNLQSNHEEKNEKPKNNEPLVATVNVNKSNRSSKTSNSNFLPVLPPKKVSSAWLNLSLTNETNGSETQSKETFSFTDGGYINPKFRSTHMSYAQKKNLKKQKVEKEKEKAMIEIYNENYSSSNVELDVFLNEEIRRPLPGIHVDIDEQIELDW